MKQQFARLKPHLPWILPALLLLFLAYHGVTEVLDHNDFTVFQYAASLTVEHSDQIYILESPDKSRPCIYAPSAAVLLMPLGMLPHHVAGIFWALLKVAATVLLVGGALRYSLNTPSGWKTYAILGLLTVFFIFRPFDNDFNNGQVNIVVAVLAGWGVWLMMAGKSLIGRLIGALLLALAIGLKLTPLLLVGVLFLHKRWLEMGAALILIGAVAWALPVAWWGSETAGELNDQYAKLTEELLTSTGERDQQVSFFEMIMYSVDRIGWEVGIVDERIVYPEHVRTARLVWLMQAIFVGIAFLAVRFWVFREKGEGLSAIFWPRRAEWTYDFALLVCCLLLISPLNRKAHLVILAIPIGWIVSWLYTQWKISGGFAGLWDARRTDVVLTVVTFLLFWAADDIPLPIPGLDLGEPYRPAFFLAVLLTGVLLTRCMRERLKATG